eukprot:701684-Pyramimonas_sp.AAC.2
MHIQGDFSRFPEFIALMQRIANHGFQGASSSIPSMASQYWMDEAAFWESDYESPETWISDGSWVSPSYNDDDWYESTWYDNTDWGDSSEGDGAGYGEDGGEHAEEDYHGGNGQGRGKGRGRGKEGREDNSKTTSDGCATCGSPLHSSTGCRLQKININVHPNRATTTARRASFAATARASIAGSPTTTGTAALAAKISARLGGIITAARARGTASRVATARAIYHDCMRCMMERAVGSPMELQAIASGPKITAPVKPGVQLGTKFDANTS